MWKGTGTRAIETEGFEIPETLCRVIKKTPVFDLEGYLLCHKVFNDLRGNYPKAWEGIDTRSLPLVHPEEAETIMRYLASSLGFAYGLTLLTIESGKIEDLAHRSHSYLPAHGEYFGKVQKSAIIGKVEYRWVESSLPANVPEELLKRDAPYFVKKTEGRRPVPRCESKGFLRRLFQKNL